MSLEALNCISSFWCGDHGWVATFVSWFMLWELCYGVSPAGALVWTVAYRLHRVDINHICVRFGVNPCDRFSDDVGWSDDVSVQKGMFSIIIV